MKHTRKTSKPKTPAKRPPAKTPKAKAPVIPEAVEPRPVDPTPAAVDTPAPPVPNLTGITLRIGAFKKPDCYRGLLPQWNKNLL